MTLPIALKRLIPGWRARWLDRYACFLEELRAVAPRLEHGWQEETPWIGLTGGPRLFGFASDAANREVFDLLTPDLPDGLPATHMRLVKDLINRYLYPHLRPDLRPGAFAPDRMFGLHGQHKDTIHDLPDPADRALLMAAFRPRTGEVILDCGCFLGFGEVRLAEDLGPEGRLIALEADPDCHALMRRNLDENGVSIATPVHGAIWNSDGEMRLERGFAQANSLVGEVQQGETTAVVPTYTVDSLVRRHGLDRLDMLSLTVNGAEVEALQAADETLSAKRPRVRLAGWYTRGDDTIAALTRPLLERHDYRVWIGPRGNVLALPRERATDAEAAS